MAHSLCRIPFTEPKTSQLAATKPKHNCRLVSVRFLLQSLNAPQTSLSAAVGDSWIPFAMLESHDSGSGGTVWFVPMSMAAWSCPFVRCLLCSFLRWCLLCSFLRWCLLCSFLRWCLLCCGFFGCQL